MVDKMRRDTTDDKDSSFLPSGDVRGETFGDRLRREIRLAGFDSARQFAIHIEMEPNYLSRIITGAVKRPQPETLDKIADGLEVPSAEVWRWAGLSRVIERSEVRQPSEDDDLQQMMQVLREDDEFMEQLKASSAGNDEQVIRDAADVLKIHLRGILRERQLKRARIRTIENEK